MARARACAYATASSIAASRNATSTPPMEALPVRMAAAHMHDNPDTSRSVAPS
jgi:hypothetical protein